MEVFDLKEDIYDRLASYLSTHPLIQDRIRENRKLAEKHGFTRVLF